MPTADETQPNSWKDVAAVEAIADRFERACRASQGGPARPRVEDFWGAPPEALRSRLLRRLLEIEFEYCPHSERNQLTDECLARFPEDRDVVLAACQTVADSPLPRTLDKGERLGRYTVRELLGQGGMGAVYRAWDETEQHEVALKVVRADRLAASSPAIRRRWLDQFSRELESAQRVRHPAIVPILDFGEVEGQPYLAMQLIPGRNLETLQAEARMPVRRAVEIVLPIAQALACLHQHDLYHCDVKPANILVDADGRAFLSDFGLALDEDQIPTERGLAGTAAYMSPEQARGEGHLVDGRTDIFSLGVVLYELLAGENPFSHPDRQKTLDRVRSARAVPLRQRHPELPDELDRICRQAMARLVDDRYVSAQDLADDLRAFLAADGQESAPSAGETPSPQIDLKGMEPFGPEDVRSYPTLVPGPRNRAGLPLVIASWLEGIAATVPRRAFRVGLIYGPSGSGKSSLVRAGILPRLPEHVASVYVDGSRDVETSLGDALLAVRDSDAGDAVRGSPDGAVRGSPDPASDGTGAVRGSPDPASAGAVRGSPDPTSAGAVRGSPDPASAGAVRGSPDPASNGTGNSQSRRPAVGGSGEVGRPAPSAVGGSGEVGRPAPSGSDPLNRESLSELVAVIRRSRARPEAVVRRKLLIVIDHFEHWLHAHPQPGEAELTAALRQCDGQRVQCLLLVREEFRTPAARFLRELDVDPAAALKESLVDLFDVDHARQVLLAIGRSSASLPATDEALGETPRSDSLLSDDQRQFLARAVQLLEHGGRVVPARLAMFVEYMRDKPWTVASLAILGGPDALATAFFDDALRRAVGDSGSRRGLDAVAAVLRALMPAAEGGYERPVRSEHELLRASGMQSRDEFQRVVDSLCRRARVLNLVDAGPANSALEPTGPADRRYQLAHDSLLPLVGAWLRLKQQESWWGGMRSAWPRTPAPGTAAPAPPPCRRQRTGRPNWPPTPSASSGDRRRRRPLGSVR